MPGASRGLHMRELTTRETCLSPFSVNDSFAVAGVSLPSCRTGNTLGDISLMHVLVDLGDLVLH